MNLPNLLTSAIAISRQAGAAILDIYARADHEVESKSDQSPLTAADLAAHAIIQAALEALTPEVPVLSEESASVPWAIRQRWSRYWLVDPLDGTREFIKRNGEFTVNIALIDSGVPVLGVVYVPVLDLLYYGAQGSGAWKQGGQRQASQKQSASMDSLSASFGATGTSASSGGTGRSASVEPPVRIAVSPINEGQRTLRVVASRNHRGAELEAWMQRARQHFPDLTLVSMGSSLKICLIAEGKADIYPRLALTSEWDTAAAQAVLEAAGGVLVDDEGRTYRYNRKDDILNPYFFAIGDVRVGELLI